LTVEIIDSLCISSEVKTSRDSLANTSLGKYIGQKINNLIVALREISSGFLIINTQIRLVIIVKLWGNSSLLS